ncbi:extracellular solute-binding protein [Brevibacillus sp. WF146]|uniref:ABC transporter substrate-binding protein n=1 Tax=Brevibacillus sp. WF146 TaxID=319501 RepID=UPI0007EDE087|nr:extracellular solute-binding protein [Brevibacillus sp. WF146]UYZ13237.1 extracellular solute-binding protein [Brevibacillus sp. WF146]
MKRAGVWLFCACLVFVLAACSGSPSSTAGDQSSGNAQPGAEPAKGETVELVMYSWRPEDKDAYAAFIAEFEKRHPGIKVKFKPFKSTEYNTILTNSLTSGTGPDIVQLRPYAGTRAMADAGYLLPLDDLKGIQEIPQSYLDAARGSDHKVYGVPLSINSAVIFYNKKLFADNGLQPPQTWDEFLQVCRALQQKGIIPIAQSGKAAYLLSITHSVIGISAYGGGDFVDKMVKGETTFKDPAFLDSIKKMQELAPFFPPDFVGIDDKDAQALFYTGKAAMYINGSYRLETFEKQNPDMPLDVIPSLAKEKGGDTPIVNWVDGSYGVVKASRHPEEAKLFMEFLASREFGQLFSDELNRVSPIPGVTPKHPLVQKMTQLSETSMVPFLMLVHFGEGTPTTKTAFEDSLQGMYINKLTVEQVAEATQASADKWFAPKK